MKKEKTVRGEAEWFGSKAELVVAASEYGVVLKKTGPETESPFDETELKAEVEGPAEKVAEFLEDADSGDVRPMCGWRGMSDESYGAMLSAAYDSATFVAKEGDAEE